MPEKIYDGITAVNLCRTKNDFEMMTALLPSKKLNFFCKTPYNLPSPSSYIMKGIFLFIKKLGVDAYDLKPAERQNKTTVFPWH